VSDEVETKRGGLQIRRKVSGTNFRIERSCLSRATADRCTESNVITARKARETRERKKGKDTKNYERTVSENLSFTSLSV